MHEWDCPRCGEVGEYLPVEDRDYYACQRCRVFWFVGSTFLLSGVTGEIKRGALDVQWIRNGYRLNKFRRVDPDGRPEGGMRRFFDRETELTIRRLYAAPNN
jgi:hypothetical protein